MKPATPLPIRVLVVDNEELVCRLLCSDLSAESDLVVLQPCFNGEEAVAIVLAEQPAVVLMDLQMPGTSGFTAIERIQAAGVTTRVIALTGFDNDLTAGRVLRLGGHGCLPKTIAASTLADAVRLVAGSDQVLVFPALLRRRLGAALMPLGLTERQLAVLDGIAAGQTNEEIAVSLFISTTTVKSEQRALESTLGVRGRVPLATRARELGLS